MPWLKNTDVLSEDPLVLSLCAKRSDRYELVGVIHVLSEYAARYLTNGFLPAIVVSEIPARLRRKMMSRADGAPPWIHSRGDACECMKGLTWPDDSRAAYFMHGYLDDNPTKDEHDLRKAKREELRSAEIRAAVLKRDAGMCRYCAIEVGSWRDNTSGRGACLDHVDPMRADGVANIVLACRACNSRKGNRTPEQAGMTLLPEPQSDEPSKRSSGRSSDAPSDAQTTPRAGRDGTSQELTGRSVRHGRANPYTRNEANPDHHAGIP